MYKVGIKKKRQAKGRVEYNVPRGLSASRAVYGVPQVFTTSLRYVDNLTLTSTSGSIAKNVFRLNSIFDPDLTNTGHQPMWHDQLAALYNKYVVLGTKAKVTFSQISASSAAAGGMHGPTCVGVVCDENGTTSGTLTELQENNTSQHGLLTRGDGGQNQKTMTIYYSPMKAFGRQSDDDTIGATVGANPSQTWFMTVYMADLGLTTSATVSFTVDIEFMVKLSAQVNAAGS